MDFVPKWIDLTMITLNCCFSLWITLATTCFAWSVTYAVEYINSTTTILPVPFLLFLSVVYYWPSVFAVRCIPCRGRMGSWRLRSLIGCGLSDTNTSLWPGLPLDGWLLWPTSITAYINRDWKRALCFTKILVYSSRGDKRFPPQCHRSSSVQEV